LREAMRTYIEWLRPQMPSLRRTLPGHRDDIRKEMQRGSTAHLRQPEASANLFTGLDLFLRCCIDTGALTVDDAARLADRLRAALHGLARRHTQGMAAIHPAEIFVDVLSTLHTQGKIRLADINDPFSGSTEVEMIGWRKGDVALVMPEAAHRRVAMFVRESGEHWAPSLRELHKELVARNYAMSTPDGRDGGQWRVGTDRKKKRGWLIPISIFTGGPQSASMDLQEEKPCGDSQPSEEQLEFKGSEARGPFLPPLPPSPTQGLRCWQDEPDGE
jgi:hypothetical protein